MPRDPEEETIQTTEGEAPEAEEVTGEESFGLEVPEELLDERQRGMGRRRKPAGPPLEDDGELFGASEEPDVPPTEPEEEAPETPPGRGRGGRPDNDRGPRGGGR